MVDINNLTFEEAMNKMEEIVKKLERNDLPLEESIELFQLGMKLSKICSKKLNEADTQIKTLVEENGQVVTKDENKDYIF